MSKESQISNLRGLWQRIKTKMSAADASTLQAAKDYADAKAASLNTLEQVVLAELPAQGEAKKLYFVPSANAGENNVYDEFIWVAAQGTQGQSGYVAAHFEQVGSTAYTPTHDASYDGGSDKVAIQINGTTYLVPYIAAPSAPVMKQGGNALSENAYIGSKQFTLESATSGADIYYTTDGSTPAITPIQKYNSAFTLAQGGASDESIGKSYTVKAIAVVNGVQSSVFQATITINRRIEAPSLSKNSGTYNSDQSITITHATADKIYYTTDGTDPSSSQTRTEISSGESVTISSNYVNDGTDNTGTALKVYATKEGWESNSATRTYVLQVAPPTFGTATGDRFESPRSITISLPANATSFWRIGTSGNFEGIPSGNNSKTVSLSSTNVVQAYASRQGYKTSETATSNSITVGNKKCYIGQAASVTTAANVEALTVKSDSSASAVNGYKQDTLDGETKDVYCGTQSNSQFLWIAIPKANVPSGKKLSVLHRVGVVDTPDPLQDDSGVEIGDYRVWRTNSPIFGQYKFIFSLY